jgi:phosphonate transport system substrate-binding protein
LASELTVFGYVATRGEDASSLRKRFVRFAEILSKIAKLDVQLFEADAYDDIAKAVMSGYVDFAWLPPIPFLTLDRRGAVAPLVHLHRGGRAAFESVLVAGRDSRIREIADVRGGRAAWVDRQSASGYVVPRLALAAQGLDPRSAFAEERFFGSHAAVVRAILSGRADFGATYAGPAGGGEITRGPWLEVDGAAEAVRVVARLGEVPGDIVAARAALEPAIRDRLLRALLAVSREGKSRVLAADAFGVDAFQPFDPAGYDDLRRATEDATARGLFDR